MNRRDFFAQSLAAVAPVAFAPIAASRANDPATRRPRILLRSSWQTVNIGDIGHSPGVLALLDNHLPTADVRLWPGNIRDGVEEMLKRRFPKLILVQTAEAKKAAFEECDFLLHGSGPSLVAREQVIEWKEKTRKPYGVFGITVSTVDEKTQAVLSGADFVYFRDTISLKLAKDHGVKSPVMEFGPDGAFAVDLRDDEKATEFLKANKLEAGQFLVAIPRLRNTPYWKIHNRKMTELDIAKNKVNEEFQDRDHAMVREALIAFVRKTGMKVLVCPEDKSHMAVGKQFFIDPLPKELRDRFVWRENYWLTDEAVSVYRRSLGLLSMDMHSPIMAVGNGIPAIHCRFKQQTSKGQMWRDIGLGEWLFDLDVEKDGTAIAKAVLGIADDPSGAKKRVAKAMEFVRTRQDAMISELRKRAVVRA